MPFSEGETIVHPFHGPVRITRIAERAVRGEKVPYYDLVALEHPLTLSVPVARAEELGLRPIAIPGRIADLLDILRAPSTAVISQWARRMKDYQARMLTGNLEDLCFVIREISRAGVKSRASAEGQLLRSARSTFALEVSLALNISLEDAERTIDGAAASESSLAATA